MPFPELPCFSAPSWLKEKALRQWPMSTAQTLPCISHWHPLTSSWATAMRQSRAHSYLWIKMELGDGSALVTSTFACSPSFHSKKNRAFQGLSRKSVSSYSSQMFLVSNPDSPAISSPEQGTAEQPCSLQSIYLLLASTVWPKQHCPE